MTMEHGFLVNHHHFVLAWQWGFSVVTLVLLHVDIVVIIVSRPKACLAH
jgi:hypothetical protein